MSDIIAIIQPCDLILGIMYLTTMTRKYNVNAAIKQYCHMLQSSTEEVVHKVFKLRR